MEDMLSSFRIAAGLLLLGIYIQTIFVIVFYYRVRHESTSKRYRGGLMPLHVWSIGVSYLVLAPFGIGERHWPLAVIYLLALVLGNAALAIIDRHKRHQLLAFIRPFLPPDHRPD